MNKLCAAFSRKYYLLKWDFLYSTGIYFFFKRIKAAFCPHVYQELRIAVVNGKEIKTMGQYLKEKLPNMDTFISTIECPKCGDKQPLRVKL